MVNYSTLNLECSNMNFLIAKKFEILLDDAG